MSLGGHYDYEPENNCLIFFVNSIAKSSLISLIWLDYEY